MENIDKNKLKDEITKAFSSFKSAINAIENINVKISAELWTVGDIAEHILLGSQVDFKNTRKSERPFDLNVNAIKVFFLNFREKHEAMSVLQPKSKEHLKKDIFDRLDKFEKDLHDVINNDDLTFECVDNILITGWGYLTKFEWIKLHEYHIIRHTHQITKFKEVLRMKKLQFETKINCNALEVYDKMLGLSNKTTFESWTESFNPSSTFEGDWYKGSKIYFIGTDDNGEKFGLVSEIIDNTPNKFVSIKHIGILKNGVEILEGPEIESWVGGIENYSFEEINSFTFLNVELILTEEFANQLEKVYPIALNKLKDLCEKVMY